MPFPFIFAPPLIIYHTFSVIFGCFPAEAHLFNTLQWGKLVRTIFNVFWLWHNISHLNLSERQLFFRLFSWLDIFSKHCSLLQTLFRINNVGRGQELLPQSAFQWRPCLYPWPGYQWVPDNTIYWQILHWSKWRWNWGHLEMEWWNYLGLWKLGARGTQ